MTETRRIILNTLATYGRSVFSLCLGLFSSRWVLAALGKQDYGLFGVVGSVLIFITFLSGVMGCSIQRYYAYFIGEARKESTVGGVDIVKAWFNAALSIYMLLPVILILIGYPIGVYAIHNWLVIPEGRMQACVWIFRISTVTVFVNMAVLPYVSMYRAYQYIAELSLWGMLQTVINFIATYSMRFWTGDKLILYAIMSASIVNGFQMIIAYRAWSQFDVCRTDKRFLFDLAKIKMLVKYASCELFSCFGDIVRQHGAAFIINRHFGVTMNAAYSISSQVSAHTTTLSSAMIGAMSPAVTSAEGQGEHNKARRLAFRTCKFGVLLILLFCIPLTVEMDEVLELWLINPPQYASTFCRCILIALVFHKLGWGHHIAITARGRIGIYNLVIGLTSFLTIFIVWAFVNVGLGALGVGLSFIISYTLLTIERVVFARKLMGMSISFWIKDVVVRVFAASAIVYCLAAYIVDTVPPSFYRVCLTTSVSVCMTCVFSYFLVCNREEKAFLKDKFLNLRLRFSK